LFQTESRQAGFCQITAPIRSDNRDYQNLQAALDEDIRNIDAIIKSRKFD
jgi:hypothetical protein